MSDQLQNNISAAIMQLLISKEKEQVEILQWLNFFAPLDKVNILEP